MKVLLAYSGGLDTSWLVARLAREKDCEVTALTIDCGGFDAPELEALRERALFLGASAFQVVDAKAELFERVLRWLIAGNVRRGGTYPISVAAERGLQAEILARIARAEGFDTVAHGCTGAGNDQRDFAPTRAEELSYLEDRGLLLPSASGRYSINAGLWGLTIGGGELHSSGEPLPEEAWRWTRGGAGEAVVQVGFVEGVPVALDGERLDPVALIERLNRFAGALGVGRGYHLGDTVLGFKGRIGYEAPAAEVLLSAHRELEKLVLTEEQRFWKDHLGEVYGRKLHQGLWHDPFLRNVEALFADAEERVTGVARVRLSGGRVLVEGVESPFSMMAVSEASYGERPAADAHPAGVAELARVLAEPARLARRAWLENQVSLLGAEYYDLEGQRRAPAPSVSEDAATERALEVPA